MFNQFITALLYNFVDFAQANPSFFEKSESEREKMMENLKVPKPFQIYLGSVDGQAFMHDMHVAVDYINQTDESELKDNALFKAVITFLTAMFAMRIEVMNEIAGASTQDREAMAEKLIPGDSILAKALRNTLVNYTYQELAGEIQALCQKTVNTPYLVIQSPREVDLELKKEIRETLLKEYPLSLPIFQVNRTLIGGLRVFRGGEVIDRSWISRVHRLSQLTSA
jgi:F0F1-type ATP synthase delta subunit